MNIYLAAPYHAQHHMRQARDDLTALGHLVTSRWIDQAENESSADRLRDDPASCAEYALIDLEDISAADVVVSFTAGGGGRGGRHVELGAAIAWCKRLILVGVREHVFHCLPQVEYVEDWPALLASLASEVSHF